MLVVFVINILIPSTTSTYEKAIVLATVVVVIIPLIILKIYMVQCMIYGNCYALTWVISGIAALFCLSYVTMFIMKIIKKKKDLDRQNDQANKASE
jgi:uncharacterized membrane protein